MKALGTCRWKGINDLSIVLPYMIKMQDGVSLFCEINAYNSLSL